MGGKGTEDCNGWHFSGALFRLLLFSFVLKFSCQTSRTLACFNKIVWCSGGTQYEMGIKQKLSLPLCWCRLSVYNFPFFIFVFILQLWNICIPRILLYLALQHTISRNKKKNVLRMLKIVKCKCFSIQIWLWNIVNDLFYNFKRAPSLSLSLSLSTNLSRFLLHSRALLQDPFQTRNKMLLLFTRALYCVV